MVTAIFWRICGQRENTRPAGCLICPKISAFPATAFPLSPIFCGFLLFYSTIIYYLQPYLKTPYRPFYYLNQSNTLAYYPEMSLDQLDCDGLIPHRQKPFQSEWEYSDFLKSKAVDFIQSHPSEFLKLVCLKAYLFFLIPFSPPCCSPSGVLKIINNTYLFLYRLLFLFSLGWFAYQLTRKNKMNAEFL